MTRVLIMAVALAFVGAVFTGCGGDSGDAQGNPDPKFHGPAMMIKDGAQKFDKMQGNCPVCQGGPIDPEVHVDIEGKGRLYFDKEECKEKFEQNRDKYLSEYKEVGKQDYRQQMQRRQ